MDLGVVVHRGHQYAAPVDPTGSRGLGYGRPHRRYVDGHQIGGRTGLDGRWGASDEPPGVVGDHSVRLVGSPVGGHDQQGGGLQGVASTDQVERILNVVGTCRNQDACLLED